MTERCRASRSSTRVRLTLVTLTYSLTIILLLTSVGGISLQAAPNDTIIVDGATCTLADAISAANSDTAVGGCTAGNSDDTIDLQTDVLLTSMLPDVNSTITLEGNGNTIQRDSGASNFYVLRVTSMPEIEVYGDLTLNAATITGGSESGIVAYESPLTINDSIITGNSVSGNGGGVRDGDSSSITINRSTISNNTASYGGGGVGTNTGSVIINNSTISGNTASYGGGLYNLYRQMTVNNSTISGNTATSGAGGAIVNSGSSQWGYGTFHITNSTITHNSSSTGANVSNSADGTIYITNSIVANQSVGEDCINSAAGIIISNGYNLESGTSCGFTSTGDIQNTDPILQALGDNGGLVRTHYPYRNSPVLDNGDCSAGTDQRGEPRPVDLDDSEYPNSSASGCDIGAIEAQTIPAAARIDVADGVVSEPSIATQVEDEITTDGICSLIEAIENADDTVDGNPNTDCIAGDPAGPDTVFLFPDSNYVLDTIHNSTYGDTGLPVITTEITIEGNGATIERNTGSVDFQLLATGVSGDLEIDHTILSEGDPWAVYNMNSMTMRNVEITNNASGVFSEGNSELSIFGSTISNNTNGGISVGDDSTFEFIDSSVSNSSNGRGISIGTFGTTTISQATISNNHTAFNGGGLRLGYLGGSSYTITDSTISANSADGDGGGIYSASAGVSLENCTVDGNIATGDGGGLHISTTSSWINRSTFSNNSASLGGAIYGLSAQVFMSQSTITSNTASQGGGVYLGELMANNSIIAHQLDGEDCYIPYNVDWLGHNIESGTSCGFTYEGDLQNITAAQLNLGPLQDNGGPTRTHALSPGGIAIDNGNATGADQRGVYRPQGSASDIGAFEQGWSPSISVPFDTASKLTWSNAGEGCTYTIWESTTPYFDLPTSQSYSMATSPYYLYNSLGDPSTNYYFKLEAQNCTAAGVLSEEVGTFDFPLIPGL